MMLWCWLQAEGRTKVSILRFALVLAVLCLAVAMVLP